MKKLPENSCCSDGFSKFCSETSLHGWKYCSLKNSWHQQHCRKCQNEEEATTLFSLRTLFWLFILSASIASAVYMMALNIREFYSATVAFNLDSPTRPLDDVFFPSAVICNMNALSKSFVKRLNDELKLDYHLLWKSIDKAFINGENVTDKAEEDIASAVLNSLTYKKIYEEFVQESLRNPAKNGSSPLFGVDSGNTPLFNWHDMQEFDLEANRQKYERAFLPEVASQFRNGQMVPMMRFPGAGVFYGKGFSTDLSENCLWLTPYVQKPSDPETLQTALPYCKNGVNNGLQIMLDAETFDYASSLSGSEGFVLSVLHHLDIPIMKQTGINVEVGQSIKVAVTPKLTTTTAAARRRFSPEERMCYFEDEVSLRHFPPDDDYRYEMSNCLFEATLQSIEAECGCTPKNFIEVVEGYAACEGAKKECMNKMMGDIGDVRSIQDYCQDGNVVRKECLAACEDQQYSLLVTQASYPNVLSFNQQPEYCILIRKLIRTCNVSTLQV